MIHVIASIRAAEGQRDMLMTEFRKMLPEVRAKMGCLEYGLAVNLQSGFAGQAPFSDNEFIVVERWSDLDALKLHITDAEYQKWYVNVWNLVAGASMQILEVVD